MRILATKHTKITKPDLFNRKAGEMGRVRLAAAGVSARDAGRPGEPLRVLRVLRGAF
jgi:hypothetical protein